VTDSAPENHPPVLSAPLTQQVDEGVNLSFTVTASDQDGDHVTLSADQVPSGASFSDHGDNTAAFSWTPGSDQSGTYNVAFAGNDGQGGTGTAGTMITVNDVGGGGGGAEVPGKACLVGEFKSRNEKTCFRLKPDNGSFDLGNVVLSSITLRLHGVSINALDGAHIELDCPSQGGGGHDGDDGHDGDGGHDGDDDSDHHGNGHHADVVMQLTGDHPHGDGDDHGDGDRGECGISCNEHEDHGDCNRRDHHGSECDTLGIRACFSTQALVNLFHEAGRNLPCDLVDAEIRATLLNGDTVVAVFHGDRHQADDGDDHDKDKGKDGDKGGDGGKGKRGHGVLCATAMPNPLNPSTMLSFTMSREGQVRVTIYDMKGRLVKTLLDGFRSAGEQLLAWDGSNATNSKVASGMYFIRIQAPEGVVVQRVAVMK
jgi:hypothetical protein